MPPLDLCRRRLPARADALLLPLDMASLAGENQDGRVQPAPPVASEDAMLLSDGGSCGRAGSAAGMAVVLFCFRSQKRG